MKASMPNRLASCLRGYFAEHLPLLRGMSPHTILSYRDSVVLLLRFLALNGKCHESDLDIRDIEPKQVQAFLAHLEKERNNSVSTRNVRLSAIHAFFRYVGARHVDEIERTQRILAIPFKRAGHRVIEYLERDEIDAVLSHIDRSSLDGRRDYVLLATMFNTGARAQEIVDLRIRDLQLSRPYQLRLFGKGRKERVCPIWPQTARALRALCKERQIELCSERSVFFNHRGEALTRFGLRYILAKHIECARSDVDSLVSKRLHPHSMRHSTAVALLKSGVDIPTISQWLGHASPSTTNRYASIDLDMKRKAIARVRPIAHTRDATWRKSETVLEWLEQL